MEEKNILEEKILNGIALTNREKRELTQEAIEEVVNGSGRWTEYVTSILKFGDRYFAIEWQRGLTENQEDYYDDAYPYEVKLIKKRVIVKEYVSLEKKEKRQIKKLK